MFDWLFKDKGPKVNQWLAYCPKDDITAYEVSKCLEIMIALFSWHNRMTYENAKSFVLKYPDTVVRHFTLE